MADDFDDDAYDDDDEPTEQRTPQQLRRAHTRATTRAKQAEERAAKAERELLIYKSGLTGLSDRQMRVLASEAEGNETPEQLREIAAELGFAPKTEAADDPDQPSDAEIDAHGEAANVAAGGNRVSNPTGVKAEDIASWPTDKLLRLNDKHPDIYEAAMRGESITLPAAFV